MCTISPRASDCWPSLPASGSTPITVQSGLNAAADNVEFKSVVEVIVGTERKAQSLILFDPHHSWDERILKEQFRY